MLSIKGESDTVFKQDAILLKRQKLPIKEPLMKDNEKVVWLERHRK